MRCVFLPQQDKFVCQSCGIHRSQPVARMCPKLQPPPPLVDRGKGRILLGDRLKRDLLRFGISEEWYISNKQAIGLPASCHCPQRIEWLNNVHKKYLKWLKFDHSE